MTKQVSSVKALCITVIVWLSGICPCHADEPAVNTITPEAESVYKINPWLDGTVLGVAGLGAAVPFLMEDQIINKSEYLNPADVNRFDRYVIRHHSKAASTASHVIVIASLLGPIVYDRVDVGWSRPFAEDMTVYFQTLALNSAIANGARYGVQRARPDAYRKPQPVSEAQEFASFYSGHTASVVAALSAMSMTYRYRHGPSVWPWVITFGAGVTDGMMRVFAGRHFYTDNMVGIAAGAVIGITVPMLHHRKSEASTVTLLPADQGAELLWQKHF